jgi:hypothetical protein
MFSVDATLIRNGTAAANAFYHDLLERVAALPDANGVAAGDGGPYSGAGWGMGIRVEGRRVWFSTSGPLGTTLA